MRISLAAILFCLSISGHAKEVCDFDALEIEENDSEITKLFYTGTCHYRNKDYNLSVENWEKLSKAIPLSEKDEKLKVDTLNNLGYMKFFGFGTDKNQSIALEHWNSAISMGHKEAEFHLCHAYADIDETTHNIAKARKHCNKAQLIYKSMEPRNEEILQSIERYLEQLGKR